MVYRMPSFVLISQNEMKQAAELAPFSRAAAPGAEPRSRGLPHRGAEQTPREIVARGDLDIASSKWRDLDDGQSSLTPRRQPCNRQEPSFSPS
jgi:hypothetical protein